LDELTKYGAPTYKRIYGDWTRPDLAVWKSVLLNYSIMPVQQYNYTAGKNSTDSSLIIDAMDILYAGNVDSFCIVSSDSDFTRLAARLREAGMYVIGMGEKKTPQPFISACELFKYLEVLLPVETAALDRENSAARDKDAVAAGEVGEAGFSSDAAPQKLNPAGKDDIIRIIRKITEDTSEEDGWAFLGMVGSVLNKQRPDFDSRNYGYPKLTLLVKSLGCFEIEHRPTNNPSVKHTFIRYGAQIAGEKTQPAKQPARQAQAKPAGEKQSTAKRPPAKQQAEKQQAAKQSE